MAQETKIVKGGFRATLALIISLFALILSIIAYTGTTREQDFTSRIKSLQTSLENMKEESSKQLKKLRDDTGSAIEKLGKIVKKENETEAQKAGTQ